MYNLAQRQGLPKVGETPDNVAANTYILDSYKTFKGNVICICMLICICLLE